jgi:uncharacterized protein YqeY
MDTKTKLTETLKDALRAKDVLRKSTVRLALAAIKNAEIDRKADLEEHEVLAILQKEVKSRRETIEGAELAGREDLIAEAEAEIAFLDTFLPPPLTSEELGKLAQDAIDQIGAVTPRDMGKVMQLIIPQVQGRADGKAVSQIVRNLLNK